MTITKAFLLLMLIAVVVIAGRTWGMLRRADRQRRHPR
jgi:hypothetical protein